MPTKKLFQTEDGSLTLFNESKNEYYHSIHGAVQESQHVFIDAGLLFMLNKKESINILEIGLGTGLNALLSLIKLNALNLVENDIDLQFKIRYFAVEPDPLASEIVDQLDYCNYLSVPQLLETFKMIHNSPDSNEFILNDNFSFTRFLVRFQEYCSDEPKFDLVYFDAFSPEVEPTLWTQSIFARLHKMMNPGGAIVTYCSKGIVRRMMQACNFNTERLKGPPGKHEMLRAIAMAPVSL